MKHIWAAETVERGRSGREVHEWACMKAAELELKTGVKWSWHTAHGKYIFNPCMYKELAAAYVPNPDSAVKISTWLRGQKMEKFDYRTLLDVAEGTGLELADVCVTCWYMVRVQVLKVEVDRMGKATYVRLAD